MKNSEKISLAVLAVVGTTVGLLMWADNDKQASDKDIVRVPDPVIVPLQDYQTQATDPVVTLTENARKMIQKERDLLNAAFDAKIAESKKTVRQAELDIDTAEAELQLRIKEGELMGSGGNTGMGFQRQEDWSPSPTSRDAPSPVVEVNALRSDGSALITINGSTHSVWKSSKIDTLTIVSIDIDKQLITYKVGSEGALSTARLQPLAGSRRHAILNPLSASTPGG